MLKCSSSVAFIWIEFKYRKSDTNAWTSISHVEVRFIVVHFLYFFFSIHLKFFEVFFVSPFFHCNFFFFTLRNQKSFVTWNKKETMTENYNAWGWSLSIWFFPKWVCVVLFVVKKIFYFSVRAIYVTKQWSQLVPHLMK